MSPVYKIQAIPISKIKPNAYNPNRVFSPEFNLLKLSILEDGYTMPIVCYYLPKEDKYEIVDGFHRYLVMKQSEEVAKRENYCLPVSVINQPLENRIASTIRHNRARGTHSLVLMQNIIKQLIKTGVSDKWIIDNLGMDKDELLRLKQITGIASLFKDHDFSRAWENEFEK